MGIPALPPPQSKSNQVGRPPPGLGDLPGQAGTPIPQSWRQVAQAGTPMPQSSHQVGQAGTPIPQSWQQVDQVGTPIPQSSHQVAKAGTPLPQSWRQVSQASTPIPQSWHQVGQAGTPIPQSWYQVAKAGTPLPQSWRQVSLVSTPIPQSLHQLAKAGTPLPQSWRQVSLVSTPISRPWDQIGQVATPFPLKYQVGISPLQPWDQKSQGSGPFMLASTPQPRDQMGQVPWDQSCQVSTPLSRPSNKMAHFDTPPRRLGDQLGKIGTQPPRLGDQLGYICVTNDDSRILGQGLVHLPLNPDYTLSTSTLKEVFPDATGLYYYSTDNLLMGVLQDENKLFPPSSGDEVLYITRKMLDWSGGSHFRMKEESSVCGVLAPKGCFTCSELKAQIDEMTVAIKELRTEISELKYSRASTQNGSELDENANMFKPALTVSDREAFKNYQIKKPPNEDKNKMHDKMEKCTEVKSADIIGENEDLQFFDDIVHTPDIYEIDKCVDMKNVALIDEDIAILETEKCVEMKTDKLINANAGIQTVEKCVETKIDENESIKEIEKCMEMKNAELIDLVSDKSPSATNESRKPVINTRTASWVLNLPNVPDETESEITSKISPIITSKAKLIHAKSIDKSVHNTNIDPNEKPTNFQSEESSEGRNLLSSNHLVTSNDQFKTNKSSICDKSKKLPTLRPKLSSKKSEKKSSYQLVNSKLLEKGGIYDSDQSVKNNQPESNGDSMPVSDQTPTCAKVGIINNQSTIKKDSSKDPNVVMFHVQRGSSFELTEKVVYDFFSINYGKVNSVIKGSSSGKWIVRFASKITKDVFYKEIEIDGCTVYTSRRLQDLTKESVKTQILLESRHLSLGWDRSIVVRKHFEKFGKVLGVVFIANKGEFKRAIVGFDDEKVAERLVGFTEVINGARVMIQRVNSETI